MKKHVVIVDKSEAVQEFAKTFEWGLADHRDGAQQPFTMTTTPHLCEAHDFHDEAGAKEFARAFRQHGHWSTWAIKDTSKPEDQTLHPSVMAKADAKGLAVVLHERHKTPQPPAAGEAAHTLPRMFVYAEDGAWADVCEAGHRGNGPTLFRIKAATHKQAVDLANAVVDRCNSHAAMMKLLTRIVNHPQLPVESVQCLRDARQFLAKEGKPV